MENNRVRLANYSLFDDELISTISDPTTQIELFLAPSHVSVYYYDGQFFVYKIVHGENSKARKFDDFHEALECGREMFHAMDESFNRSYHIVNDNLNNQGMITYLKKYDLLKRLELVPVAGNVGVCFSGEKFMAYEFEKDGEVNYSQASSSFEEALRTARERYAKKAPKQETHGYQYTKQSKNPSTKIGD